MERWLAPPCRSNMKDWFAHPVFRSPIFPVLFCLGAAAIATALLALTKAMAAWLR